jgi:hypothetical protein
MTPYLPALDRRRHGGRSAPIAELRNEWRLPDLTVLPMTEAERKLLWSLHASIFYIGIGKSVYHVEVPRDIEGTVRRTVEIFYGNARQLMRASPTTYKRVR